MDRAPQALTSKQCGDHLASNKITRAPWSQHSGARLELRPSQEEAKYFSGTLSRTMSQPHPEQGAGGQVLTSQR